ncbi:tRNA (adenosine(37)-N6)-threonylcarbamoyltransferase complex dimerization subunit type 1 TsaB [Chloroflexota bacterium]
MELAIDTSSEIAGIALSQRGEVQAELSWPAGQKHTTELAPNLVCLLAQCGVPISDIEGIFVAKGPGSFNGLRVGISTAKGMALALGTPLVGISTLEAEAFSRAAENMPICPILDVRHGQVAAALFRWKDGEWNRLIDEHITTVSELCLEIGARTVFCGQISPQIASELREGLGKRLVIREWGWGLRRAVYLAQLGWRRLDKGDCDDPDTLQPLYLRKPAITARKAP